jgi:hypothetical protein
MPVVDDVYEGRSKVGQPITRRKVTYVTDKSVSWVAVGVHEKRFASGTMTFDGWKHWVISKIQR